MLSSGDAKRVWGLDSVEAQKFSVHNLTKAAKSNLPERSMSEALSESFLDLEDEKLNLAMKDEAFFLRLGILVESLILMKLGLSLEVTTNLS